MFNRLTDNVFIAIVRMNALFQWGLLTALRSRATRSMNSIEKMRYEASIIQAAMTYKIGIPHELLQSSHFQRLKWLHLGLHLGLLVGVILMGVAEKF